MADIADILYPEVALLLIPLATTYLLEAGLSFCSIHNTLPGADNTIVLRIRKTRYSLSHTHLYRGTITRISPLGLRGRKTKLYPRHTRIPRTFFSSSELVGFLSVGCFHPALQRSLTGTLIPRRPTPTPWTWTRTSKCEVKMRLEGSSCRVWRSISWCTW